MKEDAFIFPIALDLGAKTTGVFSTGYTAGTHICDFKGAGVYKTGFAVDVADLKQGGYKLLQVNRTAARHARRGRKRNKQAKKLFCLVLDVVYRFPVERHVEAIHHLMNRRGFSYMESQVDLDQLDAISDTYITAVSELLFDKGQANIADLFAHMPPSDVLNEMVCHHGSQLKSMRDHLLIWGKTQKKYKKENKVLSDALQASFQTLTQGAKHRTKYFSAIKHDIQELQQHPLSMCRQLCAALRAFPHQQSVAMIDVFYQLLCHINNFPLKLLSAILKEIGSSREASGIESVISTYFGRWICKQWALSAANGQDRLMEIKQLQQSWRQFTANAPAQVFEFLLHTPPEQTIPPYESHTNRRPPSCQTLTLNPETLALSYPDWQAWLAQLTALPTVHAQHQFYRQQLGSLHGRHGDPLIDHQALAARQFQLVLDARQDTDPFQLNKLWSLLKKRHALHRQGHPTHQIGAQVAQLLTVSQLPTDLHPPLQQPFVQGSFWHLVNRYYQIRRRARVGRYFLHYDRQQPDAQRWQHKGQLMMMCRHRPRQLTHQALTDICTLLGISQSQLPVTHSEQLQGFFQQVKGLKSNCEQAYRAQKSYGAELKAAVYTDGNLKKLLKKIPVLIKQLAELLALSVEKTKLFIERHHSVYTLVQLYPLVWGDRRGFGKTCPVCAKDNATRMLDINEQPQASRLTTLSMRLIDGGLERLLTHQAHHIAHRLWPEILANTTGATRVEIPLILEQNRFNFSADLSRLKEVPVKDKRHKTDQTAAFTEKNQRIQQASQGVCPYTDTVLAEGRGEIDHIIPRSGPFGVLNDEANLIYASQIGNQQVKKDRFLTLADLNPNYLKVQFGTTDMAAITQQIEQKLWTEDKQAFVFGEYRQFMALDTPTQNAFRHALFLPEHHALKSMVIDAINHRKKTKVNGTQRYMAQLLADIFIAKSKGSALEGKLSFDYFEISSHGLDENSTVALRQSICQSSVCPALSLQPFEKQPNQPQDPYSHVIDATMAFLLALDAHHGEGALRLTLSPQHSIWGEVNEAGEKTAFIFEQVAVAPKHLASPVKVAPRSSFETMQRLAQGSQVHEVMNRPVFKKNPIGLTFFDLCLIEGQLYKGFVSLQNNDTPFVKAHQKPVDKNLDIFHFAVAAGYYRPKQSMNVTVYHPNKQKLMTLLFDTLSQAKQRDSFSTATELVKLATWLFGKNAGQLFFYTNKASLVDAPKLIKSAIQKDSPYLPQWQQHYQQWLACAPETKINQGRFVIAAELSERWSQHCQTFLSLAADGRQHRSVKHYAMKAKTNVSGVVALMRHSTPTGKVCYQIYSFDHEYLEKEQIPLFALNSPNIVLMKKERITKGYPSTFEKKKAFKPQSIDYVDFFKVSACQKTGLEKADLQIFAIKSTQVEVRNIPIDWFERTLLQPGTLDSRPLWQTQKTLQLSHQALEHDTLHQGRLRSLMKRACREEVRIQLKDNQLSLFLAYKSKDLAKLLSEAQSGD